MVPASRLQWTSQTEFFQFLQIGNLAGRTGGEIAEPERPRVGGADPAHAAGQGLPTLATQHHALQPVLQ